MLSPKLIRWSGCWSGVALAVGGTLEAALGVLMPTLGAWSLNSADPFLFQILILLGTISSFLLAGGLASLCIRLWATERREKGGFRLARNLAGLGLILAGIAAATPILSLVQVLTVGLVLTPQASFLTNVVYPAGLWALPLTAGLLGIHSLLTGTLGRWGALPLVLGVLLAAGLPDLLTGLGWVLLGYLLLSNQAPIGARARVVEDLPPVPARTMPD